MLREYYAQASFDAGTPAQASPDWLKDFDELLAPVMHDIHSAWPLVSNETGRLAVRSSAVGEDSAALSYAGQYATLLGVSLEGARQALWKCWLSTCERGLIEYRRINQQASLPHMAVICQLMVEAAKSGVAVSRVTREGRREALITAAYGLGVGVVSGNAATDTFCIDLDTGRVRQRIAKKDVAYRLSSGDDAVRAEKVDEPESLEPVLDRRDLARLCAVLPRIEKVFGEPQDVEFAVDTGGELRILQSRAITAEMPISVHRLTFDDSNITESFPGITSPLTFSFAQALYRDVFVGVVENLTSAEAHSAPSRAAAAHLLGSCRGKVYYNVDAWHRLLSCVPFQRVVRTAWDDAVGVRKTGVHVAFTLVKHTARQALDAVRFVLFAVGRGRRVKRAMRTFDRLYDRLHVIDWRALSAYDIRCEYELTRELTRRCWIDAMRSDLLSAVYTSLLRLILSRDRSVSAERALGDVLKSSEEEWPSIRPVTELRRLASLVLRVETLSSLLHSDSSPAEVWSAIAERPEFAQLRSGIVEFVKLYGMRGPEDLKLEIVQEGDTPAGVIGMIRQVLKQMEASEDAARPVRGSSVARGRVDTRLMAGIIGRLCSGALYDREEMRLRRSRAFSVARRLFGELGSRLADRQLLGSARDILFLSLEEAFALVDGSYPPGDPKQTVQPRKDAYASWKAKAQLMPSQFSVDDMVACESWTEAFESGDRSGSPAENLSGVPCSPGIARGKCRVVLEAGEAVLEKGEVLVALVTDPGWVHIMSRAGAIVVEKGNILSHSAIVGRELGIPTVVNVPHAARLLATGDLVEVDGNTGSVRVIERAVP